MRLLEGPSPDRRVLVLTPTRRDATITEKLLAEAGIEAVRLDSFESLLRELERGAAALLFPEELLTAEASARMGAALAAQPAWSDLPILVLTRPGADSAASGDAVRTLGNVTLLERPIRGATLLSAVRTALRARERQYQIRVHLSERSRALESLRQADQRKDEFLATLGHELRNPLAPLLNGLTLLQSLRLDDPVVERTTALMERQVHHLVRLVDDLLEVSRITRGLITIEREPVSLATILRSAIETSQPQLSAGGHHLHLTLAEEKLVIAGDAVRLIQVFSNLLTNAAKYTDSGGEIWVTLARSGERACVSVRDTGIGIPAGQLESVFEMFMQMDRSDRRAQGGLGIGLTLVRSLVEMHGGRVEARSAGPGKGSEFRVELPLLPGATLRAPAGDAAMVLPPRRVLVVDDNGDAADSLVELLRQFGAEALASYSGDDALAQLPGFAPEVVLLDIGMPEMDGYEVARRIRAAEGHAGIVLVALTGWGQEQDFEKTAAAGFDHHLVKPVEIARLAEILGSGLPAPSGPEENEKRRDDPEGRFSN